MQKSYLQKICFILPVHYSAFSGGAEYQVKLILESLLHQGKYDITYFCRNIDPGYVPDGYKTRKVVDPKLLGRYSFAFDSSALYRALKELSPQIIYQRVAGAYTGIAAYYAKKHYAKMIWHISNNADVMHFNFLSLRRRIIQYLDLKLLALIPMAKFSSIFKLVWIERLVYRVNFCLEVLSGILSSLILVFLWMAIYRYSGKDAWDLVCPGSRQQGFSLSVGPWGLP